METINKTWDEYLVFLEDKYSVVTYGTSVGGNDGNSSSVTIKFNDEITSEKASMTQRVLKTKDDYTVILNILSNETSGWHSAPYKKELGTGVGCFQLDNIIKALPESHRARLNAEEYLANNPEMLISKLSNVLNMQKKAMDIQSKVITSIDWDLASVFQQSTKKAQNLMRMLFKGRSYKGVLTSLNKVISEDKD